MKKLLLLAITICLSSCQDPKSQFVGSVEVNILNYNKIDLFLRIHNCLGETDTTIFLLKEYRTYSKENKFTYRAVRELQYTIDDIFYQALQITNQEDVDSYVSVYRDSLLTDHVITWSSGSKKDYDFFNPTCWSFRKEQVPILIGTYKPAEMVFRVNLNNIDN